MLVTYPEMFLDVIHLGPGNLSTMLGETPEGTVVAGVFVRVVAHIRMFTEGAQVGVASLCKWVKEMHRH
jgi:hypothetical protein